MNNLAKELSFKILDSTPQSIADQWWFWIEFEKEINFPKYIQEVSWKRVGSV
jgi:hypothetical protein